MHCVCAGEHIDNTGQVVRDAEERPIPGPGTAQYQPGLYQNLGQRPNPDYGTVPGLHQQLLLQRLQRRVRNELVVAGPSASSGRRPRLSLKLTHRTAAWLGTVRED